MGRFDTKFNPPPLCIHYVQQGLSIFIQGVAIYKIKKTFWTYGIPCVNFPFYFSSQHLKVLYYVLCANSKTKKCVYVYTMPYVLIYVETKTKRLSDGRCVRALPFVDNMCAF